MPMTEQQYPVRGAYFAEVWVIFFILLFAAGGMVAWGTQINSHQVVCSNGSCQNPAISIYVIAGFIFLCAIAALLSMVSVKVNLHYTFDDTMITLKQGLFSREEKYMPYEAIQNISVKQNVLDKLFGIASLKIQNAAAIAAAAVANPSIKLMSGPTRWQERQARTAMNKNTVEIPGLSKQDAEALRDFVLQKTQANQPANTGSGL